ncbi:MAG: hypothetical protein A2X94_07250 [Bdellovibrionales bacterium GWB1_55_8]|nr:MAG: hypothetical protein A2X94_07250 [Bdellovibrionales bacterium GWB1_55_8]
MREHPWHLPSITAKHYQQFRDLADLHDLTLSWLRELRMERESYFMPRGENRQIAEHLWMLAPLSDTRIDLLLDDSSPDELLSKLEYTVWTVQAWTLSNLLARTPEGPARASVESILDLTSWRQGRSVAEKRWKGLRIPPGREFRGILLALADTPFGSTVNGEHVLIKRSVPDELEIEWLSCPHQKSFPDVLPVSDRLCHLHSHWVRGFIYALDSKVATSDRVPGTRCSQKWSNSSAST